MKVIGILGAGPAGIAAAAAVIRHGGRVVIIDHAPKLGGSATNAEVGTICGLSLRKGHESSLLTSTHSSTSEISYFDNPGFASEFAEKVSQYDHSCPVTNEQGLCYLPYTPAAFEAVARAYLDNPLCSAVLSQQLTGAKRVATSGTFQLSTPDQTFHCDAVVDCSGNATLATLLGYTVQSPDEPQSAAIVFSLRGLPITENERTLSFEVRKLLREGAISGALPEALSFVSIVPGSLRLGSPTAHQHASGIAHFKLALDGLIYSDDNEAQPSTREQNRTELVTKVNSIIQFLTRSSPRFAHLELHAVAQRVGIRSGNRGIGEEPLRDDDVLHALPNPRGVALGMWPCERWRTPHKPELLFPQNTKTGGNFYEIPLGALCSRDCPSLYFAGRTIAATDTAIASARVMGTCLSTGYAAGYAALAFQLGVPREAIINHLRELQVNPLYERLNLLAS